jgi:hypothetical protein
MFAFISPGGPLDVEPEQAEVVRELANMPRVGLPPSFVGQMLWAVADQFIDLGEIEAAHRIWRELDEYADRVQDPYVTSWRTFSRGTRAFFEGDFDKQIAIATDLENRAESLGIPQWGMLIAAFTRAGALARMERPYQVLELQWAFDEMPWGDGAMAGLYAMVGRLDECHLAVEQTLARIRATGEDLADACTRDFAM